jgi:spore germination cell wall hydrolase CwlJ-like protein
MEPSTLIGFLIAGLVIYEVLRAYNPVTAASDAGNVAATGDGLGDVLDLSTLYTVGSAGSLGDLDTLARTIYGEARGEGDDGQTGVAWVIRNRANAGPFSSWPHSIAQVCTQGQGVQFNCWRPGDVNYGLVRAVTPSNGVFAHCIEIARGVIGNTLPDPTGGATYYHDTTIAEPQAWINAGLVQTVQIGRLVFYRGP